VIRPSFGRQPGAKFEDTVEKVCLPGRSFEIDAGKLAEEARFDGIFVLRTNPKVAPLQAVLRYRDLLQVENLFLRSKAIMRTWPIFHSSDAAIGGYVFCSFLALSMQKFLDDLGWRRAGMEGDVARSRSGAAGAPPASRSQLVGPHRRVTNDHGLVRHAHVALPPRARQTAPPRAGPPSKSAPKRRGQP
jgi:hypothetical protein